MASKKRKKVAPKTASKTATARTDALVGMNAKLIKRVLCLEYLLETMLGNDLANMTPEYAERMAVAIGKMEGHPLGTDKESQKLVGEFLAKALAHARTRRPADGGASGTMQ